MPFREADVFRVPCQITLTIFLIMDESGQCHSQLALLHLLDEGIVALDEGVVVVAESRRSLGGVLRRLECARRCSHASCLRPDVAPRCLLPDGAPSSFLARASAQMVLPSSCLVRASACIVRACARRVRTEALMVPAGDGTG